MLIGLPVITVERSNARARICTFSYGPDREQALWSVLYAHKQSVLACDSWVFSDGLRVSTVVLSIIALPYVAMILNIVVWVVPTSARVRRRLCWAAQLAQAWNCQDIFVAVLATSDNDLAPITAFSADTACEPLTKLIPSFVGPLLREGGHCFSTGVDLKPGFWWLVSAAAVQWLALLAVCGLSMHCHDGRDRPEPRKVRETETPSDLTEALLQSGRSVYNVPSGRGVQRNE